MPHKKHYQSKYGDWAGNPKGNPPDYDKCAKEIREKVEKGQLILRKD